MSLLKTNLILTLLLLSPIAHAEKISVCDEKAAQPTLPCALPDAQAGTWVADMLFSNVEKHQQLMKTAKNGFTVDAAAVTLVSDKKVKGKHGGQTVLKYELLLNDCRGTDYCHGKKLWTVTETVDSDGYTYGSIFVNEIATVKSVASSNDDDESERGEIDSARAVAAPAVEF